MEFHKICGMDSGLVFWNLVFFRVGSVPPLMESEDLGRILLLEKRLIKTVYFCFLAALSFDFLCMSSSYGTPLHSQLEDDERRVLAEGPGTLWCRPWGTKYEPGSKLDRR